MELKIRKAKFDDCDRIFELSNDPIVRENSLNQYEIKYENHVTWFSNILNSKDFEVFIVENLEDEFVGQVRFEKKDSGCYIGLSICKEFRGKHLGFKVIELGTQKTSFSTIFAIIKRNNIPSLKSFMKAGYKEISSNSDSHILVYDKLSCANKMVRRILVVVAHPDDEILGCGATIRKMVDEGAEAYSLILSAGKASRDDPEELLLDAQNALRNEMGKANAIIQVKKVFTADFPDNTFDTVSLLSIVKKVEEIKRLVQPEVIFTHHIGDMNIDHQLTHKAVLTATRPMAEECVKEIFSFEVPSSTEWNSFSKDTAFVPNVFFDVSETLQYKIQAMAEYESELCDYPHTRSLEYIADSAKLWGAKVGLTSAEAFMLIRKVSG